MAEALLEVRNLTVYYETESSPVRAVEDVSLNVHEGEIFGIVGESGCGKSTLALAILRLLKPPGVIKRGRVFFEGTDLLKLKESELRKIRWRKLSYIPQSSMNALNPVMRVGDQIAEVIEIHEGKHPKHELSRRVKDLLVSVGLAPEVAKMYPHELSGGMRQRVVIAMAIALNPRLLIADEPTTALDVVVQRGVLQLLKEIRDKLGISLVLITHDMAVQAEMADRIGVMYAGKIVEVGDVNSIFDNPLHPYTKLLIASIPSIAERKRLLGIKGLPPDLRHPPPGCRFHPRCPFAIKGLCDRVEPPLEEISRGRYVACHMLSKG